MECRPSTWCSIHAPVDIRGGTNVTIRTTTHILMCGPCPNLRVTSIHPFIESFRALFSLSLRARALHRMWASSTFRLKNKPHTIHGWNSWPFNSSSGFKAKTRCFREEVAKRKSPEVCPSLISSDEFDEGQFRGGQMLRTFANSEWRLPVSRTFWVPAWAIWLASWWPWDTWERILKSMSSTS